MKSISNLIFLIATVVAAYLIYNIFTDKSVSVAYTPLNYQASSKVLQYRTWGKNQENGELPTPYKHPSTQNEWGLVAWNLVHIIGDVPQGQIFKIQQDGYYNANIGYLLGFFKGCDLNPLVPWDWYGHLKDDIRAYLNSPNKKSVDAVTQGEFLPKN